MNIVDYLVLNFHDFELGGELFPVPFSKVLAFQVFGEKFYLVVKLVLGVKTHSKAGLLSRTSHVLRRLLSF